MQLLKGGQGRSVQDVEADAQMCEWIVKLFLVLMLLLGVGMVFASDEASLVNSFSMTKDGHNAHAVLQLDTRVDVSEILKKRGDWNDKEAQKEILEKVQAQMVKQAQNAVQCWTEKRGAK